MIGEELNGLGYTIKQLIDNNISKPEIWKTVKKIKGTLVVREKSSKTAVTVFFDKGNLKIQNGEIKRRSAFLEAGFEELAEVSSGQVGPVMALLSRKIWAWGNLWKLLKMARALINKD